MFSALILICSVVTGTCNTIAHPATFGSTEDCYNTLAEGLSIIGQNKQAFIAGYKCLDWTGKVDPKA